MDKKITLPEETVAKLLVNNGYFSKSEIEEFLQLQSKLRTNNVLKKLEEIFIYKELAPKKIEEINEFLSFVLVRLHGIIFCQIALASQILQSPEVERVLITQRALFLLKKNIYTLDQLLEKKDKISKEDLKTLRQTCEEFNQTEYEKLVPQAISYLMEEDKRAKEWREEHQQGILGTKYNKNAPEIVPPPISKPLSKTSKIKAEDNTKLVAQNTDDIQKKPSENADEEIKKQENNIIIAPQSAAFLEDTERTGAFEVNHYQTSHHLGSTSKIAFIATGIVCVLLILFSLLSSSGDAETLFNNIQSLYKNKNYSEAEEKCQEFDKKYSTDKRIEQVKQYWQDILILKADIAQRQQRWAESLAMLQQALTLLPSSQNSEKIKKLLQDAEQQSKANSEFQSWQSLVQEFSKMLAEKNIKEAQFKLSMLQQLATEDMQKQELKKYQQEFQNLLSEHQKNIYRYYSIEEMPAQKPLIFPTFTSAKRLPLLGRNKQYEYLTANKELGFTIVPPYLYAFSANNGSIIWVEYLGQNSRFRPIFLSGRRPYENVALAEFILVVSYRNSLKMLDMKSGEKIWETEMPALIGVAPVLYRGKIYVGCLNQNCYQIDAQKGNIEGAFYTEKSASHSVSIDRKHRIIYIPTQNKIYAFNLSDGKLSFLLDIPNSLSHPVMPVFPYFITINNIIPSENNSNKQSSANISQEKTNINFYHITQQANTQKYSTGLLKQEQVPGTMLTPGVLAGGLLAIATNTHLAIYGIHPTNPKESFFNAIPMFALPEKGPAFLQFTNFFRNILIVQKKAILYEIPDLSKANSPLIKQHEISSQSLPTEDWNTICPPLRSGSLLFWTQKEKTNENYQVSCFNTEGKLQNIWQRQWAPSIVQNSILTKDNRLCFLAKDGTIHEISLNEKKQLNYRMINSTLTQNSTYSYIPENDGAFITTKPKLNLSDSLTGWLRNWKPEITLPNQCGLVYYHNGNIFLGSGNSVFAFSTTTGKKSYLEYSEFRGKPFLGEPIFYQDSLWIGNDNGNLYQLQLRPEKNALPFMQNAWSFKTKGPVRSQSLAVENILYFGSDDTCLYALDLSQKKLLWQFKSNGAIRQRPFIQQDKIYFVSENREVYCLNKNTGNLIWKSLLSGKIKASPVKIGDKIYITSLAGECNAYHPDTGDCLKNWQFGTALACSPTSLGEYTILAGSDGFLYVLDF